jgi:hypothetical protein
LETAEGLSQLAVPDLREKPEIPDTDALIIPFLVSIIRDASDTMAAEEEE